jgi:hypothetical protein
MDDLRQRFAALDRIAAPDLRPDVERRLVRFSEGPAVGLVDPRLRWRGIPDAEPLRGRRFTSMAVLLLLGLLVIALIASLTAGAGWWERRGVLVPPSSQAPVTPPLTGDCPGAVRTDGEAPPVRGWSLGPQPGFLASVHPGRITALWHEPRPDLQPPGGAIPPITQVVLVEIDPIERTMCRLLTPVRIEQAGLVEGAAIPDAQWTSRGDAFAFFRGDVETVDGCCAPGQLIVWSSGRHGQPGEFPDGFANLAWSNRGAWLAVTHGIGTHDWAKPGRQTITIYSADGSEPRDIRFECEPCVVNAAAFSPNDTRLAGTFWRVNEAGTDADQLVAVADVATGEGAVLDVGPTRLHPIGWRDDDTILAVDDGRRLLAIPVGDPSAFTVIASFPLQLGVDGIFEVWSPDRSRVAFERWNTDQPGGGQLLSTDVFVLDVATGVTRHIARESGLHSEFVWAPDDRTFAYTVDVGPSPEQGVILKVADALEGAPVAIAKSVTPIDWRPEWR